MCGRFTRRYSWRELHRLMRLTTDIGEQLELKPSYNVAPTQKAPIVRQDAAGRRWAAYARWGLVPFWADDVSIGNRLINARSEDAATKPSFRAAVKKRRCLIPVDGFYEWQSLEGEKRKQPWLIFVKDAPVFAFAGLWERWEKAGEPVESFTILTGAPNELVAKVHNRMPCIVRPEHFDLWLDPVQKNMADFAALLEPCPADRMDAHAVSARVNSPANNDETLVARM